MKSFSQDEIDRIARERDRFLSFLVQFPDTRQPTINAFGSRIAQIAEGHGIYPPVHFCEYLHYGVAREGLDSDWAKVASAIQFLLGPSAEDQILARYDALAKLPKAPVFLCHASEDKVLVRKYAAMLHHVGYAPWLDERELVAGQDWDAEIKTVIKRSFAFVVFISGRSHKPGYIQDELRHSLEEANRFLPGAFSLSRRSLSHAFPQTGWHTYTGLTCSRLMASSSCATLFESGGRKS